MKHFSLLISFNDYLCSIEQYINFFCIPLLYTHFPFIHIFLIICRPYNRSQPVASYTEMMNFYWGTNDTENGKKNNKNEKYWGRRFNKKTIIQQVYLPVSLVWHVCACIQYVVICTYVSLLITYMQCSRTLCMNAILEMSGRPPSPPLTTSMIREPQQCHPSASETQSYRNYSEHNGRTSGIFKKIKLN